MTKRGNTYAARGLRGVAMPKDKTLLDLARNLAEAAEEFYTNLLAYDRVDIDTLNYIEHIVNRIRSLTATGI